MRYLLVPLLTLVLLTGCGGGSSDAVTPTGRHQAVGEIFAAPSQVGASELRTNFGYAGNVPTSRAIQQSGRQNILDLLFVTQGAVNRANTDLPPDMDAQLASYAAANADLLTPGVRVLIADEIFWDPQARSRDIDALQRQLDALQTAVAAVRRKMPQASIGITVTPYATFDSPNATAFIRQALALVDWAATDVYWLGDPSTIAALHEWSAAFAPLARAANPRIEVWYIAQAFKLAEWDLATFRQFIAGELANAASYDGILFFGWQFASELTSAVTGASFDAETKSLYRAYLE